MIITCICGGSISCRDGAVVSRCLHCRRSLVADLPAPEPHVAPRAAPRESGDGFARFGVAFMLALYAFLAAGVLACGGSLVVAPFLAITCGAFASVALKLPAGRPLALLVFGGLALLWLLALYGLVRGHDPGCFLYVVPAGIPAVVLPLWASFAWLKR